MNSKKTTFIFLILVFMFLNMQTKAFAGWKTIKTFYRIEPALRWSFQNANSSRKIRVKLDYQNNGYYIYPVDMIRTLAINPFRINPYISRNSKRYSLRVTFHIHHIWRYRKDEKIKIFFTIAKNKIEFNSLMKYKKYFVNRHFRISQNRINSRYANNYRNSIPRAGRISKDGAYGYIKLKYNVFNYSRTISKSGLSSFFKFLLKKGIGALLSMASAGFLSFPVNKLIDYGFQEAGRTLNASWKYFLNIITTKLLKDVADGKLANHLMRELY